MNMLEKSCGTILYTIENGTVFYLLILGKRHGIYGFPKGHMEDGETEEETAFRETWEETSVKPDIKKGFRKQIQYRIKRGKIKTVVYFLAEYTGQTPCRNGDFEDFAYPILSFEKAYEVLGENIREVLKEADAYIRANLIPRKEDNK